MPVNRRPIRVRQTGAKCAQHETEPSSESDSDWQSCTAWAPRGEPIFWTCRTEGPPQPSFLQPAAHGSQTRTPLTARENQPSFMCGHWPSWLSRPSFLQG